MKYSLRSREIYLSLKRGQLPRGFTCETLSDIHELIAEHIGPTFYCNDVEKDHVRDLHVQAPLGHFSQSLSSYDAVYVSQLARTTKDTLRLYVM